MKLHIGFERSTGDSVDVEMSPTSPHIAIFGQTGLGKTVLVRRIMAEVPKDCRVLAFDTREGVEEFRGEGHHLPIYVRETTDPLVLKGLLESIIQSSLKREYATLVRVSEGTEDYAEVIDRLDDKIADKKTHAVVKDMCVLLRDLLQRLMTEIRETETAGDVELRPGLNVMALNDRSKQFKQLAVRAVLPLVYRKYRKLVVFLDEGQEYIPQKYSSAAKEAVDDYIRTARGKEDYMVIAAQSITGTDKDPLKQVHTWLMFGQATKGEAEEALEYVPHADKLKLTKREIQTMPTGFAVVSTKSWAKRTYVQPPWLQNKEAIRVAKGEITPKDVMRFEKKETRDMDAEERKKYEAQVKDLHEQLQLGRMARDELAKEIKVLQDTVEVREKHLALLEKQLGEADRTGLELLHHADTTGVPSQPHTTISVPVPGATIIEGDVDLDTLARKVADMLTSKEYHLNVDVAVPEIALRERMVTVNASDTDNPGRLAILIAEGFLDSARTIPDLQKEFRQRGWGVWSGGAGKMNMLNLATRFATMGFVRVDGETVVLVPAAKKRIRRERA